MSIPEDEVSPQLHPAAVSLALRLAEKKRARRRVLLWRLLIGLIGVSVAVAVGVIIWVSPLLALRADGVAVEGASSVEMSQAIALQGEQYVGVPLARIPLGTLRERIEADPAIAEARIVRDWPDGMTIQVSPRVPVLSQQTEGGYALIADDGITVATVVDPVEGLAPVSLSAYGSEGIETQAETAAEIWEALRPISSEVSLITVADGSVTVTLNSGATVLWGDSERSELKTQVLLPLLAERPGTIYDLIDPTNPSVR